jgi:hypothetical protein
MKQVKCDDLEKNTGDIAYCYKGEALIAGNGCKSL